MIKSIFKEIIIILLLLLIIIILLGIIFYDYIPSSKMVPTKVSQYQLEETVQMELEKELNSKSEEIVKTYQLDATDIENYERTNDYNKGKVNPFAEYSTGVNNNQNTSSNNASSNNTTQVQDPSKDNFLNTTGK